MTRRNKPFIGVLAGSLLLSAAVLAFLVLVFPHLAQWIVGSDRSLPVPRTLLIWYLLLLATAIGVYVTSDSATMAEFIAPLRAAVVGGSPTWQRIALAALAGALPLGLGALVFIGSVPPSAPPALIRQQHPGMSSESAAPYVGANNPFRKLRGAERDEALVRGRGLYARHCAVCHGGKHDGAGLAARGMRLRPVNFRDPGTIATLVEDAVFWRVNEGWVGLPTNATPWDSAMPRWHDDVEEDDLWRIVLSEFEDAAVAPRIPEGE